MADNRLLIKEKIGHEMSDAGCNIIFGAIMLFVNYFYTDIFGLTPAPVDILLLSVYIIDAVTDPIMDALADRTRSKYGRFRPRLLWIAFPYTLFSMLMFTAPEWTYNSKAIHAFVTYFPLSVTYTAINIPYCSLGTVMAADPREHVACQSYRFMMVGIATLLLSLTLLPMADWFGGADKAKGYRVTATMLVLIGVYMFLFCSAVMHERTHPTVQTNDELKKDPKDMWKNDQWIHILLLTLCNVCPGFIRMAATMYYITWVMGQNTHFAILFINLGVVGVMIGSVLVKVLADRWYELQVFFWTSTVLTIFSRTFYFFNPYAITLIMVLYLLLNILHQIPSPLHWSLMSDVGNYGEWKTGRRITGISFSDDLFPLKIGLAIIGTMVGFLLSWYGYDTGAKTQSASALNGIMFLFSVIPDVGYLVTADVARPLKVNRALMHRIQSSLEKRRSNYNKLNEYRELKTSEHVRKA